MLTIKQITEKYLEDLVNDYYKRINKYHKLEIIELKDENIEVEAKNILKYINNTDYVITLEIDGKMIDSLELAKLIDNTFLNYGVITFVIGSSYGLHESIKKRSNLALSFSKLTFPHGLFRGILLEQIYRAFKINNNESYHK